MSNFKVVNVENGAEVVLPSKKSVAEFLVEQGVEGKVNTILKGVNKAMKTENGQFNENFKIEEIEEDVKMNKEVAANEVVENNEEVVYDNPAVLEGEGVPEFEPAKQSIEDFIEDEFGPKPDKVEVEGEVGGLGNAETEYEKLVEERDKALETNQAILVQEIEQKMKELKEQPESEVETVPEVNEKIEETIPEIEPEQPAAEEKPQTEEKPKEEKPKENKRRVGKGVVAFKNGTEYQTFPSIKACATHFKELMNLGHMPFTPIMKSIRQGIDWNEWSFCHENEADLYIPESLKKKIEESKQKQSQEQAKTDKKSDEKPAENAEQPIAQDEVIEEIVEEIVEEPIAETK